MTYGWHLKTRERQKAVARDQCLSRALNKPRLLTDGGSYVHSKIADAERFLLAQLENGPKAVAELKTEAHANDFSWYYMTEAFHNLSRVLRRCKIAKRWHWYRLI